MLNLKETKRAFWNNVFDAFLGRCRWLLVLLLFSNIACAYEIKPKKAKSVNHFELAESMLDEEYCSGLLDFTNTKYSNAFGHLSEQLEWKSLSTKKIKFLNGKVKPFYETEAYLEIDITGDKKTDTVMRRISFLNNRIYHTMHILNNKLIKDVDLVDMNELRNEWMIYYRGKKNYSWSLSRMDAIVFGWLDVVSYRGKPIFIYLDNLNDKNQNLLYFNIDPQNPRKTTTRTVVGISPLCLLIAKNGFTTNYLK